MSLNRVRAPSARTSGGKGRQAIAGQESTAQQQLYKNLKSKVIVSWQKAIDEMITDEED